MQYFDQMLAVDAQFEKYMDPSKVNAARYTKHLARLTRQTWRNVPPTIDRHPEFGFVEMMVHARYLAWMDLYPNIAFREVRNSLYRMLLQL